MNTREFKAIVESGPGHIFNCFLSPGFLLAQLQ